MKTWAKLGFQLRACIRRPSGMHDWPHSLHGREQLLEDGRAGVDILGVGLLVQDDAPAEKVLGAHDNSDQSPG